MVIHGPDQQSVDDCRALLEIVKDEVEVDFVAAECWI